MSVGHVIVYKRTPPAAPFIWALLILGLGFGLRWYLENGEAYRGDVDAQRHGLLILSLCVVVSGLIVIAATAKLWFRHLWHKRQTQR
ncbi:MAG: hypothetical protein KBA51_02005 [Kiritimatiellae bacterium]|nr:hypothetical protein [Kiritimatiellia bacterium]